MKCEQVRELLGAYCAGELGSEEAGEIKKHVTSCSECARECREMTAVVSALKDFERIEPREDFSTRLWEKIEQAEARKLVFRLALVAGFLRGNRRLVVTGCVVFAFSLLSAIYVLTQMGGGARVEVADRGVVSEGFVMREIPQEMDVVPDTVYTHFVTGDRPVHLTSQPHTYVYKPVVRPTSEVEMTF
jgi:anti-sigma factor RsiW